MLPDPPIKFVLFMPLAEMQAAICYFYICHLASMNEAIESIDQAYYCPDYGVLSTTSGPLYREIQKWYYSNWRDRLITDNTTYFVQYFEYFPQTS